LTKKLTERCQALLSSAHAEVVNKKAHQANALMGFVIFCFAKPAPMASRGTEVSSDFDQLRAWPGLIKATCFDEWITKCDRHERNILYNGIDDFWLIDHQLLAALRRRLGLPDL